MQGGDTERAYTLGQLSRQSAADSKQQGQLAGRRVPRSIARALVFAGESSQRKGEREGEGKKEKEAGARPRGAAVV